MNERFESLMYNAGMTAQGCWDEMDGYQREAVERFALLIVRECANIANNAEPYRANDLILKHFEVEELKGWVCPNCGNDRTKAVCPLGHSASVDGRCPMVASTL